MANKQNYATINDSVKKAIESYASATYELAQYNADVMNGIIIPVLDLKGIDYKLARLNENLSLALDQFDRAAVYRKADDDLGITMTYDGIGGLADAIVSNRCDDGERAAKVILTAYGLKSFGSFPSQMWDELRTSYISVKVQRKLYKVVKVVDKPADDVTTVSYSTTRVDRMITRVENLTDKKRARMARRKTADYVRAWLIDHLLEKNMVQFVDGTCIWSDVVEKAAKKA